MATRTGSDPKIALQGSVLTRLSARLRSRALDGALAQGTPPETDAALALRARRLTTLRRRRVIANGLRRVIRDACREGLPSQPWISPRPHQVVAASDELVRLADALASPGPVAACGVAQAWLLLTDGTGPLYNADSTTHVRARAVSAAESLRLEH